MRRETGVAIAIAIAAFAITMGGLKLRNQRHEAHPAPPLTEALAPLLPGQARVRFLDPNGHPVTECMANLWQPLEDGKMAMNTQTQVNCKGGVLLYTDLPAATYRLQVASPSLALFDKPVTMVEGESVDFGDVTLGPGALLTGELVINGEPAPGARVRFDNDYFDNTTDAQGRFRMRGAPLGMHSLRGVAAPALSGDASIEITAQGPNHVVIELEPLPERGTLGLQLEPTGQGMRVTALHPKGPGATKLSVGEVILAADGASMADLDLGQARALLAGDPGSTVRLETDQQDLELTRAPRSALSD